MVHPFPSVVLAAWLFCSPSLPAQPPAADSALGFEALGNGLRFRCVRVPGVTGVCAVLAWRVGADHDPVGATGLAAAVGEAIRRTQVELPPAKRCSVAVSGRRTMFTGVAESHDLAALMARLREVLAGELPIDDDLAVRAAGGAALEADSEINILPGTALRWMVCRSLLAGTPAGRQGIGVPEELKQLEPSVLRARYEQLYTPRNALLVMCGGIAEATMEEALRGALEDLPAGAHAAPEPAVHDSLGPPPSSNTLDRVMAPYVTLALRAPDPTDADYLPFAVAMTVVDARATRVMRIDRGREVWGRFPRVFFDYAEGGRIALINRRARDGEGADGPRAEIQGLVDGLHEHGARPEEIAKAVELVARRLRLPPYPEPAAGTTMSARGLYGLASTLVVAEILGWPRDLADRVRALPPSRIDAVLRAALAPADRRWFELVPPL